ncbi:hypothetical protein MPTK1_4g00330 [Marchantia polymorpha subsp. ruderalis]|uniref:Uncharacterized protein n=2 Tax=Marchantia polymorpha TaxID=3197 RepID=A0AAF6B4U0_MARPO|nr:hypothetical protein MARPO_0066s0108 [Marchantia polymorpha]BBN07024.1 hypothetical protein Mp_4g00330 [Marchantia polymorpha subsp. ruderalis]|eukprot:PTQ36160.1 hypothetical protein MARPO_0066s0108 [Marchantia polymorpha]
MLRIFKVLSKGRKRRMSHVGDHCFVQGMSTNWSRSMLVPVVSVTVPVAFQLAAATHHGHGVVENCVRQDLSYVYNDVMRRMAGSMCVCPKLPFRGRPVAKKDERRKRRFQNMWAQAR